MKKLFLSILLSLFVFNSGTVFSLEFPQDFVLDNLPGFIQQLKRTAVLILVTDKKLIVGTGFLTIDANKRILVVTNQHVASRGKPIFVRVNAPDNKVVDYLADIYRADEESDVALLTLKKITPNQQWVSTDAIVPFSMFGNSADITEGKEIVYIGYPLGLGAEEKNYPVSRQGMIAQAIPGRSTFLIDGMVSHGNSGSPVFSRKDGKLLGLISSFEPDYIDSFEDNRLISRVPFNAGMSKATSAEAIKALLTAKQ